MLATQTKMVNNTGFRLNAGIKETHFMVVFEFQGLRFANLLRHLDYLTTTARTVHRNEVQKLFDQQGKKV